MSERDYSKDCRAVLRSLDASYTDFQGDPAYLTFNRLRERTGLPWARVRIICRALKRKGLTKYGMGLCTEDGEFYGSGYAITDAGHAAIAKAEGK